MFNSSEKVFPLVFVFAGLIILGVGINETLDAKSFKDKAVKADGIVTELTKVKVKLYRSVVEYIDHNGVTQLYE